MRIKQNEYSAYDNKTEWLPVLHILREPLDLDNFLEAGKPGQVKLVIYIFMTIPQQASSSCTF